MTENFSPPGFDELFDRLKQSVAAGMVATHAPIHFVGIHTGGAWVAERLHAALNPGTPLGTLDVSFYRDDYGRKGLHSNVHGKKASHIPFDVAEAHIVIVDDVFHTGRTVRAALNELFDYGRPKRVELAVLVDRGTRELPIVPSYCARALSLPPSSRLSLRQVGNGLDFVLETQ